MLHVISCRILRCTFTPHKQTRHLFEQMIMPIKQSQLQYIHYTVGHHEETWKTHEGTRKRTDSLLLIT